MRIGKVLDRGHQILTKFIVPPGSNQFGQSWIGMIGERKVAIDSQQINFVPERNRREFIAGKGCVGGINELARIYLPYGGDHRLPACLVLSAAELHIFRAKTQKFDILRLGHLRVVKDKCCEALKPGVDIRRLECAAPRSIFAINVRLQHNFETFGMQFVDSQDHSLVRGSSG